MWCGCPGSLNWWWLGAQRNNTLTTTPVGAILALAERRTGLQLSFTNPPPSHLSGFFSSFLLPPHHHTKTSTIANSLYTVASCDLGLQTKQFFLRTVSLWIFLEEISKRPFTSPSQTNSQVNQESPTVSMFAVFQSQDFLFFSLHHQTSSEDSRTSASGRHPPPSPSPPEDCATGGP